MKRGNLQIALRAVVFALAWLGLATVALAQTAFPVQFPPPQGGAWCQGMDLCFDYTKGQGSPGLAFPPGTDTHSAVINAQSSTGGWQSFNANSPVITDLGIQTVPTRTNSIRNNSMVGAVAGSPGTLPTNWAFNNGGTLTTTVIGTGTENGLPYIDLRINGTTSTTFIDLRLDTTNGIAATNGVTWAGSVFCAIKGGSVSNIASIALQGLQRDSGGSALTVIAFVSDLGPSLSTGLTRFSGSAATNNVSTAYLIPQVRVGFSSGVAIDITLRIGAPQQEVGAFASPPILTTSAAATVSGNQQVVDLTGNVGGIIQYTPIGIVSFGNSIAFTDGAAVQAAIEYGSTSGPRILAKGANSGETAVRANSRITVVFAFSEGYQAIQQIGGSKVTQTATSLSITKMAIGGSGIGATANLYQTIQRLAIKRGVQNDATFNDLVAKATILAAVSQ